MSEIELRLKYKLPQTIHGATVSIVTDENDERYESLKESWKACKCVNGRYIWSKKEIVLLPRFFEMDVKEGISVFWHEFMHHVHSSIAPYKFRQLWRNIHEGDSSILYRINTILGTEYDREGYVTNYARRNEFEDLAESLERVVLDIMEGKETVYNNIADIKMILARQVIKKYTGFTIEELMTRYKHI